MSHPTPPQIHPLRALLSPFWLGALALLVVNDHFLKGAGLLPGEVTGKLSDFAGLFLAPTLMAAVLLVRSRRGLLACHIAVGIVFAAIQVSAEAAAGWSAMMGLVGFPWHITRDVTDLIALPALVASWQLLIPRMQISLRTNIRRSLEFGTAGAGLLASVATSPPPEPFPGEVEYAPFDAAVYLNNASDELITVRLRELRPELAVDCFELSKEPGRIPDAAFGDTLTWNMPARTNIPASGELAGRDCHAVLVDGDGLSAAILFWFDGEPPVRFIPGQTFEDGTYQNGAVVIEFDADGVHQGYRSVGTEVVFDRESTPPEYGPGCEPQSDGDRLDWSDPVPTGLRRIEAAEIGPDGCVSLDLASESQVETGESDRWYLCLPTELWGPNPGSWIFIERETGSFGTLSGDFETISLELRDGSGEPLLQDKVKMVVSRGRGAPELGGLNLVVRENSGCEPTVDEACGTLGRGAYVQAWADVGSTHDLHPGDGPAQIVVDDLTTVELAVMHAEQRYLLDPACAEGSNEIGADLELAAVIREAE